MSCPECFRGGITTSHPTGAETTIHDLPTYVAQPPEGVTPKGIIIIITDAFGWKFPNNRVLSDHYAQNGGFLVYCPDFMNGHSLNPESIPLMDKIMNPAPSWFSAIFYKPIYVIQVLTYAIPWKRTSDIPKTRARVLAFFQALRTSDPPFPTKDLKIGAAGFCWGGKHAIILAADTPDSRVVRHESQTKSKDPEALLNCVFTAHPSYIEVPKDLDAISVPTSVVVGDQDMAMKTPQILKMKEILEAKEGAFECVILPGAKHGFAVRTHPEDKHEVECAEKAEVQAISWFTKWFT